MKKLILLTLSFIMCGCVQPVGSSRFGKKMVVPIEEGATRLTITSDYIIVETCDGHNIYKVPSWKCDKIINNDATRQEVIHRLK
jgi:hypothetical protein